MCLDALEVCHLLADGLFLFPAVDIDALVLKA